MKFPKITKKQIFNIKVKNYNQIFRYAEGYDETKGFFYWNIVQYGNEWYLDPSFWIDFIDRIYEIYGYIQFCINNASEETVKDFFLDFKKQILYAEMFIVAGELKLPRVNKEFLEEDSHFLDRFFNEDKTIKYRRIRECQR